MAKEVKSKSGKKDSAQLKNQVPKQSALASRIKVTGPGSETAKISKEEAAQAFAEAVLKACDEARAEVQKTTKGKCFLVKFTQLPCEARVMAFVFGGDHVIVSAESDDPTILFTTLKRTFGTVEDAAKFVRCAFIKDKVDLALKVPFKPQKSYGSGGSGGSSSSSSSNAADHDADEA